jgi:phage-related protein
VIYSFYLGAYMRRLFIVGFFVDQSGCKQVEDYLFEGRNITDLNVLINVIQRLAYVGQDLLDTNMAKHIDGPLFELRKDRHRIFYCQDGDRFVLLSAFTKATQKTPPAEIRRAFDYFNEYQQTKNFFELGIPPLGG